PVVGDRRGTVLLGPDVGSPLMGLVAISAGELDVENRLRHPLGLDVGADLQARCGAGALHLLKPLRDREVTLNRFPQMEAGSPAMGYVSVPVVLDSGDPCPLFPGVGRRPFRVASFESSVGQDRLRFARLLTHFR